LNRSGPIYGVRCASVVTGDEHQFDVRALLFCLFRQLDPVPLGHNDVREEYIDVLPGDDAQCLVGAPRGDHPMAAAFDDGRDRVAREIVIIDLLAPATRRGGRKGG
jgi:hypothetical protein